MANIEKAKSFIQQVKDLAKWYDLPVFVVTDVASGYSNNDCEAVRTAAMNHEDWKKSKTFNPEEDWYSIV